jgi:hypothetical protein
MKFAGLTKEKREMLKKELYARYEALLMQLEGVPIESKYDCAGPKKYWTKPEQVVKVEVLPLQLALGDFKTILAEIAKLK